MSTVIERLGALRKAMKEAGAQWYFMTTADPHGSEYISDHYKEREFFSGFLGSNGDLLVGTDRALLWTDGRYFVQAGKELEGSGIELMRSGIEGVPQVAEWLKENTAKGDTLLLNGKLVSASLGKELREAMASRGGRLRIGRDLTTGIWQTKRIRYASIFGVEIRDGAAASLEGAVSELRPKDSAEAIRVLPKTLYEQDFSTKLADVRRKMKELDAQCLILSRLEDQMWLFNIRGGDILYNPVAYAYTVITFDDVTLYVKDEALTGTLCDYSYSVGFILRSYEEFYNDLLPGKHPERILLDTENTNYLTLRLLQKAGYTIIDAPDPTEGLKAVKKGRELERIREIYRKDSAVLTSFLRYIKENAGEGKISEIDAAKELDRRRIAIPECNDLSFPTISAFGANAAMMHYNATDTSFSMIENNGLYLVDSGGQYDGGTTDVTRTLVLGEIPAEVKRNFTRTVIGMLSLQNAVFLKGCTGRNLDILARRPLWEAGLDYKCGTGHGVGYMLSVHEGPQSVRPKKRGIRDDAPLKPGMLLSDEPGVYVAGQYGLRIENILLVREKEGDSEDVFYCFEPLTYVPIDLDGIDTSLLSPADRDALNEYHRMVREKIAPLLSADDAAWLERVTAPIDPA